MKMKWKEDHEARNASAAAFVAGLIAGGIAAALFTPSTGRAMRKRVKAAAREGGKQISNAAEAVAEAASSAAANGKAQLRSARELAADAVDTAKSSYREAVSNF